jgi:glycosyltransferase involved in cell wall biosynthesis
MPVRSNAGVAVREPTMKPLITALVDTYNHERYIEQALVSVLEQGLSAAELEIVVVDDGSTDNAPAVVKKFLPRIKYLRKNNGGQASAFNAAYAEISGEVVATLDGDDWWARGKLAAVLQAFEQHPEVPAVSHGYYEFDEESGEKRVWVLPEDTFLSLNTVESTRQATRAWRFRLMGALTVRRAVLERAIPIPEVLTFQADTPIAMAALAAGVLVLAQPLFYYRHHATNLLAGPDRDVVKLRRKCEMDETLHEVLYPLLQRLRVRPECIAAALDGGAIAASQARLRTCGGRRLETFRTEMRAFHAEFKNPGIGYLLFKYLGVGAAAFLLPPRLFYEGKDWYARHNLRRLLERLFKTI